MTLNEKMALVRDLTLLEAEIGKRANYKFNQIFPDEGPFRRELYRKPLEFFELGARYPQRMILGGNRVGKTKSAAFEATCHITGLYPSWWTGRRFTHPIDVWVAGDTATTTRDIIQLELYGPVPAAPRTGMIPGHLIKYASPKHSIPGGIESMFVKHVAGGESSVQFKSFDQGREAYQGTSRHLLWFDEEPPDDVVSEALMRTMTVDGIMIITFTPMNGLTPFLQNWIDHAVIYKPVEDHGTTSMVAVAADEMLFSPTTQEKSAGDPEQPVSLTPPEPVDQRLRTITMITWDDVPHLTEQSKQQLLSTIPPHRRDARSKGIPHMGAGVIYPIPEDEVREPIIPKIPDSWPRGYGMDVGWNWTAAVWGAYDPETATYHIYKVHKRTHAEPAIHAEAIKAGGLWIPGRIDPAANGRNQIDGRQLIEMYRTLGLDLDSAENGVESGIDQVWNLLAQGRLKVGAHLHEFWTEYRMYRRNEKGQIIKKNDHLMDCLRYLIASGLSWLVKPSRLTPNSTQAYGGGGNIHSWMG